MNELLIIQSGNAAVARYLDRSQAFHQQYAERCGADFWRYDGVWPDAPHPAWNRIAMCLDAFGRGYRRVLWLDADTLVVDPDVNVFEQAPWSHEYRRIIGPDDTMWRHWTTTPFVMRRTAGGAYWPPDAPDQYEQWNDGVLLVHQSAVDALEWWWSRRNAPAKPWHSPTMWELNWLLDYVKEHPSAVTQMDQRFNWQPFNGASPEQYAVIKAWHGIPHEQRWQQFSDTVDALVYP